MGLERYFRRARWDRERREEIESYLQMETDENIARGMQPEAARQAARRWARAVGKTQSSYNRNERRTCR